MVGEDTTGPVGVIAIDLADFEPAGGASLCGEGPDDATLAQALMGLAARETRSFAESPTSARATGCPRLQRGHFMGRLAPFWATPTRVTANLGGLAVELEQLVAQVLRRIAANR